MLRLAALGLCLVLGNADANAEAVTAESGAATSEAVSREMGGDERARLEARIAALEARVAALEAERSEASVPDDEAMERVMVLTERMMRRFFAMVREMKGDVEGEEL